MSSFESFRDVIDLWPSPAVMAREIGAGKWAARKWKTRDKLPAEWWASILRTELARSSGLTAERLAEIAASDPVGVAS